MSAWGSSSRSSDALVARLSSTTPPTSLNILPLKTFSLDNWETVLAHLETPSCKLQDLSIPRDVPPEVVDRLAKVLQSPNCALTSLHIGDNSLNSTQLSAIFAKECPSVHTVDLCNKAITDADFLSHLVNLQTLDLSRNQDLKIATWSAVAGRVDLSECKLGSVDLSRLTKDKEGVYEALNLTSNFDVFADSEVGALEELMGKCKELNLTNCKIAESLCESAGGGSVCSKLILDNAVTRISASLVQNCGALVLANNPLLPLDSLVPEILANGSVTDLDLSGCKVMRHTAFPGYLAGSGLKRLRLFNNSLKDLSREQVLELAGIAAEIEHVDVSGNDMSSEWVECLLKPLGGEGVACTTMELGGNDITEGVEEAIKAVQAVNGIDLPRDIPSSSAPMTIAPDGGGGNVMGGGGIVEDDSIREMMKKAGWKTGGPN